MMPFLIELLLLIRRNRQFLSIEQFNVDFEVLVLLALRKVSGSINSVFITWRRREK